MNRPEPRLLPVLCAVLLAAGWGVVRCEEKNPVRPPQKATAEQLIIDAQLALSSIAKAARTCTDKSLDPNNVRQQPFWAALKQAEETVRTIKTQLKERDPKFFVTLNDGTQDSAELRALYPRSGIKNPRIDEGVKAASNALTLLRRNYGREAARKKKGGELTESEKMDFAKIKDLEKTLVEHLQELKTQAESNKHLNAELSHVIEQLKTSIDAPVTAEALSAARELIDVVQGEWSAYSYYVEPKYRQAWKESNAVKSLETLDDINVADDPGTNDWMSLDESVEIPAKVNVNVAVDDPAKKDTTKDTTEDLQFFQQMTALEIEQYYAEVLVDDLEEDVIMELEPEF